ncbi:MAG: DUF2971 domain-containing protein [Alteromonadaceae bacterium]|nr:DUF2971 domain-containing protein [Alteromonadaceae bacterium]
MDDKLKNDIKKINKVYRFFSDDDYNFEGVAESYLWFSEVKKFNDPFEVIIKKGDFDFQQLSFIQLKAFLLCNDGISLNDQGTGRGYTIGDLSEENLHLLITKKFDELSKALNEIVLGIINKKQHNKFHCLAHDAKIKPLENRLMWSHYASGLRGFVLEFEFDPILDSLANENGDAFDGYTLINYTELGFNDYIKSVIDNDKPLFADRMLFSKHTDWQYENELRLICSKEKSFYDPLCISRVIIGQKMLSDKKENLIRILTEKGLMSKTYITSFDRQDFSISIEKYEK